MDRKIVKNVGKAIMYSLDLETKYKGNNAQFNIINKKDYKKLLLYCEDLSKHTFIDALGGTESVGGLRRYRVNKTLDDVLKYTDKGLLCGLKTYHFPLHKISEWEEWEDGYIEVFIRMDGNSKHAEYFVWIYIKMKNLNKILIKFKNKLTYYE